MNSKSTVSRRFRAQGRSHAKWPERPGVALDYLRAMGCKRDVVMQGNRVLHLRYRVRR